MGTSPGGRTQGLPGLEAAEGVDTLGTDFSSLNHLPNTGALLAVAFNRPLKGAEPASGVADRQPLIFLGGCGFCRSDAGGRRQR